MNQTKEDEIERIRSEFPFNEPLYLVLLVIAFLSIISFVILPILSCLKSKPAQNEICIYTYIFLITNLIHTLAYTLNRSFKYKTQFKLYIENNILCYSQSIIFIFFSLSRNLWIFFITYIKYITIVKQKDLNLKYKTYLMIFCIIGFGVPLLFTLFYDFKDVLGLGEYDCWIKEGEYKYGVALLIIKNLITLVVLIFCVLIMRYIYNSLKMSSKEKKREGMKFITKTLAFPMIKIICEIVSLITTILLEIFKSVSKYLGYSMLLIGAIQGVLFPLILLFTSDLLRKDKKEEKISISDYELDSSLVDDYD